MNPYAEKMVGKNLRTIRERKKMTQNEVAAKMQLFGCDITRSAIAKIEVGQRHLYPDELLLLKNILDTSFDEILNIH